MDLGVGAEAGLSLADRAAVGVLARTFPVELVDRVIDQFWRREQRVRQLPARLVFYFVLVLCLFPQESYRSAMKILMSAFGRGRDGWSVPTAAAIGNARHRLGSDPVETIVRQVVKPIADGDTPGAWYRGWRLVAFDGTTFTVPDTEENGEQFGRPGSGRGEGKSAYPQAQAACLVELGTHAVFDARLEPYRVSENTLIEEMFAALKPGMLIMDQRVTTQPVLGELDARGVKFLTLRMRSPTLIKQITALTSKDFKTITLDRPSKFNRPKVHESTGVRLTSYPATVRQLIITGLGRDAPTVITNDNDLPITALIEHYARQMTIEQRLAEIIQAFHADALSSTVNLNVDLDIMLCVLAQALIAALRARLPGYASVTPDVVQRRFLETPGKIITTDDAVTVRLDRRAYAPVLRQANLPTDTTVPWWGNRTLRYELT